MTTLTRCPRCRMHVHADLLDSHVTRRCAALPWAVRQGLDQQPPEPTPAAPVEALRSPCDECGRRVPTQLDGDGVRLCARCAPDLTHERRTA